MIPVQDVVPNGRPPLATLALIALNVCAFAAPAVGVAVPPVAAAIFGDAALVHMVMSLWFLWLFGDNVEARAGRLTAILIYVTCGWVAVHVSSTWGAPDITGMGVVGGVTGILGAYFLLMPHSRVLMLVPMPAALVEAPAMFFLGFWWVVQLLRFVVAPAAARLLADGGAVWALAAAMLLGALICRVMRRPVVWQ